MASPNAKDVDWVENQQQDFGPGPAFTEAQHWIEQVTGRSFGDKDFRTGLENGILLCELLNAIKPGAVKKINRLPTPIAGLDNITLFLRACEELGLKGSQLFDPGDLQDMTNRATIKVSEYSRKMKNVLITIYWLGKTANSCTSYSGPTLNLKEFEGLLSQIQKEMEDTDSPKRSIRDSGYIDSWDSERSDSLSPPRHNRDDSFDSLDSFGSRSQQTPSPEVILRGSSDGRGSDSESDITQKAPDVKRDDMSVRRTSYSEPKSSLPFNQYLPNKSNHTAYMPAPLRKKRAERGESYRKSWSNTTSPVGAERPFSHSHPETIEEEQNEESCQDEDFAEPPTTFFQVQGVDGSKTAVECEPASTGDADSLKKQLQVCVAEDPGHRATVEGAKWERKDEEEVKKLKRIQNAGITLMPASKRYCSCKPEETFLRDTCTAEYFQRTPSPILVAQTVTLSESSHDSSEEVEDEDERAPDLEKDDMMSRRIKAISKQSSSVFNRFLPVPSSQQGQSRSGINKGREKDAKKMNKPKEESLWTYSPTDALSDDTGSVSMNDMRPEDDVSTQPHSKARHEELHNIHSRLREDQDKWQEDLARWKNRRRSASQDLIKRKEERDIVEKIMSGERSSERRKSIKTYREIVEEKECREHALQEAYKKARTPEEAEAILKKYSQRFIISEPVLESLVMPKFLERSQSVDSDTPSSPTKDSNSLKYLRQQSLPIQKYTATVEAMIIPSSQSETNFSATVTSPTRSVASKAVPMLTPKPYSQPKDSQTVLKSFKKDGKIRINGDTSPTFTRVEDKEYTSAISSPTLTKSQAFEGVARVDNPPLKSQTNIYCNVSGLEQLISSTINDPQTEDTEKEERTEMPVTIPISQQPSTEEESELKPCCNATEKETVKDAAQEEDHHWNLETSTVHIALSNNVALGTRNTADSKALTIDEACLNPEKEEPSESAQKQLKQEALKSETIQHSETGDVFDFIQKISEVEEGTVEDSQPVDAINQQEPPNTASVPVTVRNSWRRSEFFSQPAEVESNENINIPVAPLNLPKRFDRWYWDPEEERKRQERWQKEQERLLQERYRREQEKLRQEWEKAQREVEEEGRRYHEEERKIIQETVTPLTPRSPPLSINLPNEWISPSKTEENRNSEHPEGPPVDWENKQVELQKQTNMVETESWQAEDKGPMQAEEEQQRQKGEQQESTSEQTETLVLKTDEDGQRENWDEAEKDKLEKWHWQTKQLGLEEQKLNLPSEVGIFQMDKETVSESQNQTAWQIPSSAHQQLPTEAAGSPVIAGRSWNTQEFPSFLEVQRKQQQGVQDVPKTGSLDRSWSLQSNMMDRKKWSGSHESLQSGQSLPLPHSSPPLQLQSPSRSVSGKKLCSTCGLPLGKGAAMIIETLSLYFHIQCFTCGICQGQLGDATTGTDVRIRNGLLNCNDCYIRSRTAGQPTTL
ncbi:LIM and calponin homology domains-containing protein 1-like isoform X16 [Carcharodon carcharias]|uniref:LIM and calponin homology domains-containing protein 1-like isoform X16 n=1 Tax=Carcharodon carcharias TaxID=13397 RepID=UPI001B7DC50A|nr:LIM and calponin homology domains-containing protein 1-like isoform X16 [Carcharodon carcharias]